MTDPPPDPTTGATELATAPEFSSAKPVDEPDHPGERGAPGERGDRRELAAAVVAAAAGGGLGVLVTARVWSTVTITRLAPLGPLRHDVSGRTLQPGVTGLAVVALAGVLAVLATRGVARRIVGAVLVLVGAGMLWRSLAGLSAVSDTRARQIVLAARAGVSLATASATDVTVHPVWAVLGGLGGVLVIAGGLVTLARGGRWRGMSARYESPVGGATSSASATSSSTSSAIPADPAAAEAVRARADLALWQQLDRGEDPTATEPTEPTEPSEPSEQRAAHTIGSRAAGATETDPASADAAGNTPQATPVPTPSHGVRSPHHALAPNPVLPPDSRPGPLRPS